MGLVSGTRDVQAFCQAMVSDLPCGCSHKDIRHKDLFQAKMFGFLPSLLQPEGSDEPEMLG